MNRKHIIRNLRQLGIAFDENLSTKELNELLYKPDAQNRFTRAFNLSGCKGKISVAYNAAAPDEEADITIAEDIGKDAWTGEGINLKDIQDALNLVQPKTRALNFKIDSQGGSYNVGCSIHNELLKWPGVINKTIVGVAASTASWMIPADNTRAFKNSQFFAHRAMCGSYGNEDDHQGAIDFIKKTNCQIAQMYVEQSDKTMDEMLDMMKGKDGQGTLMTGAEAKACGLVDEIIDGEATNHVNFTDWLNSAKAKLSAQNKISAPMQGADQTKTTEQIMNKTQMLALLNKWGVTPAADATDEQLIALVNAGPKPAVVAPVVPPVVATNAAPAAPSVDDLQKQINNLTTANTEAKRIRLANEVRRLITEDRLPAALEADTVTDLMRDETRLENFYNKLPAKPPGAEPIGALLENSGVEVVGEALDSIQKFVLNNTDKFRDQFVGKNVDNYTREDEYGRARIRKEMANRAKSAARAISGSTSPKNRAKILAAWNTNSIDAGLQRQVIFTDFIEEFAITLLPMETFSKKFENVPLEGTDEVDVPFYPRSTATAQSWDPATGYAAGSFAGTTLNTRPIKVGATATADSGANAAAGTAKDRKWIGLQFSSNELRRQPYENWEQHAKLQANALAVAITKDVISRVICAANFGASAKAVPAALFAAADIADLTETANGLYWPTFGRWLVVDHTYLTPLLKDTAFKQYLAYGSTDPIRKAQIKEAYGFENILVVPNLANYAPAGETLKGWINHESAVLLATAPVMPTEDVMALLSRYDLIAHPSNNMVLEHRRFADLTLDLSKWTVECSYGAEKGRASSLQRITAN